MPHYRAAQMLNSLHSRRNRTALLLSPLRRSEGPREGSSLTVGCQAMELQRGL